MIKLSEIIRKIEKRLIWIWGSNRIPESMNDYSEFVKAFKAFTYKNRNIKYKFKFGDNIETTRKHKWVGAQYYDDRICFIPNDETRILTSKLEEAGNSNDTGLFKWTGGTVWNKKMYCFPRTENCFLVLDGRKIKKQYLDYSYPKEHHYGGVCTKDGIVYQPPRDTNHILKTNLKTGKSEKIYIIPSFFNSTFRYCGSILHPNGLIYFLPENNRVIVLNPKNDKWAYIGKKVQGMVFDAKVGIDGNIYGFSAYGNGILKIDVKSNNVEMIHDEIYFGSFGTKYGVNGLLYSIPGDGEFVWSYDVERDMINKEYDVNDLTKAKYAGGAVDKYGHIICAPAESNRVLIYEPDMYVEIPYNMFNDCY